MICIFEGVKLFLSLPSSIYLINNAYGYFGGAPFFSFFFFISGRLMKFTFAAGLFCGGRRGPVAGAAGAFFFRQFPLLRKKPVGAPANRLGWMMRCPAGKKGGGFAQEAQAQ